MSEKLISYYSSIITFIEQLIGPDYRAAFQSKINPQNWFWLRQFIAFYAISFHPGIPPRLFFVTGISFFIWIIYAYINLMLGLVIEQSPVRTFGNFRFPQISLVSIIFFVFVFIFIVMTFFSYWRYVEFFRDRRYSVPVRILLFLVFLSLVGVLFVVSADQQAELNFMESQFWRKRLGENPLLTAYIIIFLVPTLFWAFNLFLETLSNTVLTFASVIKTFVMSQKSFPKELILDVHRAKIPLSEDENAENFYVNNLDLNEVTLIRKLAETNLDGTEKRSIPIAISIAFLAIFAGSSYFQKFMDKILGYFFGLLNRFFANTSSIEPRIDYSITQRFVDALFFILIIILINLVFMYFLTLIRNIGIQNVIVQVCNMVEYNQTLKLKKLQDRIGHKRSSYRIHR